MIKPKTLQGVKWFYVYDSSGTKILGKHRTKKKALAQLRAIEISKKRRAT